MNKAEVWRKTVRRAEVANALGSMPMTRTEPFGAHDDPQRFRGSVLRVKRAGGPRLVGIVDRTAAAGRAVYVKLLESGDRLRTEKFLGSEVESVLLDVEREPGDDGKWQRRSEQARAEDRPARWWGLGCCNAASAPIFLKARKVVEYTRPRGGEATAEMTSGVAVLERCRQRAKNQIRPRAILEYLGSSRYRLRYGPRQWVDFESDPP